MELKLTRDFLDSLSVLNKTEQKRTRETIFSIKNQNTKAGLRLHKIEHPSNKIFSYSVNEDIRLISHQIKNSITILFVGHHDESYNWISKRKFIDSNIDEITIISTKELSNEIENPLANELHKIKTISDDVFIELNKINDDNEVIEFISNQPQNIQDLLLSHIVNKSKTHTVTPNHFIKVINDDFELENALKYPLEQWRIFLHPSQEEIIQRSINDSLFITGCPGTGKTVCLIHKIKKFEKQLNKNECIILTTFKDGLMTYLSKMLKLIEYNVNQTFIDDISQIKIHEGNITTNALIDGVFQINENNLFYFKNGKKFKVRHLLFDEFQDFRCGQINIIKKLICYAPFTLSFDYSQAIYRTVRHTIEELDIENKIELIKLNYSYRINSNILNNLKQVVKIIRVLSNESIKLSDIGLKDIEEELIQNSRAAIIGSPIEFESYDNADILDIKLQQGYNNLLNKYSADEIVITSFFNDLYKNLSEKESFHNDSIPKTLRSSYKYVPTLKGKEFKAGILILDDTICQMLNMNMSIFIGKVDTGFKGGGSNYRLNLNLFYVALSRFRDYLKIYYPSKFEIIIKPIFEINNN